MTKRKDVRVISIAWAPEDRIFEDHADHTGRFKCRKTIVYKMTGRKSNE